MQVMVLEGGMKGWVKSGPQFTRLMDGYKEKHWEELFKQENDANLKTKSLESSGP